MKQLRQYFSYEAFMSKLKMIQNPKDRALMCIIYATGARACEVVGGKATHWSDKRQKYVTTEVRGMRKKDISPYSQNDEFIVFKLQVAKKRKPMYREAFISVIKEPYLARIITDYVHTLPDNDESWLFPSNDPRRKGLPVATRYVYDRTWKYFGTPTHDLRHNRAFHLRTVYGFDVDLLTKFFQWADMKQALTYSNVASIDIVNQFKKADVSGS